MAYACSIVADSLHVDSECRLTSFQVTFPRFILAEVNTHRMLSRNFESSRAVPVEKKIRLVEEDPFVPLAFGKNRPGMQSSEVLTDADAMRAEAAWRAACYDAICHARRLVGLGVHKQLANRVLEPFSWVTGIISGTDWENFFALRCHPAAQPEFQALAFRMRDAYRASIPRTVEAGDWHLPKVDEDPNMELISSEWGWFPTASLVSAARCARVSTLKQDIEHSIEDEVKRGISLIANGHMSPLEMPARCIGVAGYSGNYNGFTQLRKAIAGETVFGSK